MRRIWIGGLLAVVIIIGVSYFITNALLQLQSTVSIITPFASVVSKITRPSNPQWTLMLTGDVIPARSVNFQMVTKNDFRWSVAGIADLLQSADSTLINLESPLIPNCPLTNEGMVFCGDQRFIESLTFAGIDVANVANNHSLNYGWEGLGQTENLLHQNSILTTGYTLDSVCEGKQWCSRKTVKEIRRLRVGFLGYSTVGTEVNRDELAADIASLDADVDVLVVSFHWGAEYSRMPVGFPDDPREIAHLAVDNGADVVVGNHPHWIQGREFYKDKIIFYALGNTVFDQEWSQETKEGIIAQLFFDGTILTDIQIHPVGIRHYGEAYLLEGAQKELVLQVFTEASRQLMQ